MCCAVQETCAFYNPERHRHDAPICVQLLLTIDQTHTVPMLGNHVRDPPQLKRHVDDKTVTVQHQNFKTSASDDHSRMPFHERHCYQLVIDSTCMTGTVIVHPDLAEQQDNTIHSHVLAI